MALLTCNAFALELNQYFTDHMVIQRDKPTVVRGTADKGSEVTVEFAEQKKSAKTDAQGNWAVTLDPMPANSQGQKLTIHSPLATRPLTLDNVVVGDVHAE